MALFTLCRIGFFLFNREFFPGMSVGNFMVIMLAGLKFDLTAVLYTNLLFILLLTLRFGRPWCGERGR
jgi:hypothetical protein